VVRACSTTIGTVRRSTRPFLLHRLLIALLPLAFSGCVLLPPLDLNQTCRLSASEPVAQIGKPAPAATAAP